MKTLVSPNPNLSFISSIKSTKQLNFTNLHNQTSLLFPFNRNFQSVQPNRNLVVRVALDSPTIDQFGLLESNLRNPTISTSYRDQQIPKPNQVVLEAQARVCTGPTQTKPLTEEQMRKVLDTIIKSVNGELQDEEVVSKAQMGAFFAAMTIRANAFPEATQWSEGERRTINSFWPVLVQVLPPDLIFIADPDGSIMREGTPVRPQFIGNDASEMRLVGTLREVLAGQHLSYEEVQGVLRDVLPLDGKLGASHSLLSAFFIGQRMNRETDRELQAYCLAFDDEFGPAPVADVRSLTHYGEPYDGNTRFFRSTLFVAAVRACYGESCLLHGVEWMPPKGGITEEQMLKFMGANTNLSPLQAKLLLEEEDIGFAYVSQREASPSLFSLVALRDHMKKRPPLATSEKVQQFIKARGKEAIIAGFYHEGYVELLLSLMKTRGVHSGLVVKGEEGALSMTTKSRSVNSSKGLPVNHCAGFRTIDHQMVSHSYGVSHENFSLEVIAKDFGFNPTDTPRTDRSVIRNLELGLAALNGEKGPAYDRIVLNAGMVDYLLGCDGADDIQSALDRAREAIDSGRALSRIMKYIKVSHKVN